jgi:endonuclease/exonuclease/phosphatase family metal-dependent hydrolase
MQEVNDVTGETGGVFESLGMLQQKCGFSEKFMAADFSFHYQNRDAAYGNAILSNLPLSEKDVVFVQGEYRRNYDDNETTEDHPRNFQHTIVQVSGQPVHILNFHGVFVQGTKNGNADTFRHVQAIADYAERFSGEPTIITGDFNLAPESQSMQILSHRFRNLPVEYNVHTTYSPILHVYNVICDYIYVNEPVIVRSFTVAEDIVSDHKALILEFDLA